MRTLRGQGRAAIGLDLIPGPFTDEVGSIADGAQVARAMAGVDAVLHAATLHKPHVATHPRGTFVEPTFAERSPCSRRRPAPGSAP